MTKNQKVRAGKYIVFHIGPMAYTVECEGEVLAQFRNLSTAFKFASDMYFASKAKAA